VSIGKENSPPKPRNIRRQTMPEPSPVPQVSLLSATPRLGVAAGEISTILGRSPRTAVREAEPATNPTSVRKAAESASSLSSRKHDVSQQNLQPKSPVPVAPSSPLPQPSPDPWMMGADQSSIAPMDKMAVPIGGGGGGLGGGFYNKPNRPLRSRRHASSKSVPQASIAERARSSQKAGDIVSSNSKPEADPAKDSGFEKLALVDPKIENENVQAPPKATGGSTATARHVETDKPSSSSSTDPKFDMSKITSHYAEGPSQIKKERGEALPVDRKEEARRRLAERKQKKLLGK
jgi:hypothetical protein